METIPAPMIIQKTILTVKHNTCCVLRTKAICFRIHGDGIGNLVDGINEFSALFIVPCSGLNHSPWKLFLFKHF